MEAGLETAAYETCTCPPWTIVCVAEQRLAMVTAEEAMQLAALEPPKSCFISRMGPTLLEDKDADLIKSGIFPFLLQNIVRYEQSTRLTVSSWDYPNWFMPLRAVTFCLMPLYKAPHSFIPESKPRLSELRPNLPKIVDTIWNDRELFKAKGTQHPDSMREAIATFFGLCSADRDLKTILYTDKALEIILICMLDMSRPYWPEKFGFINMVDHFLNPYLSESSNLLPIPVDWISRIFKIYDPQYIMENFTSRLRNQDLVDDALTTTLLPIVRFMQLGSQDANWRRAVVDSNIHIPLVYAIARQFVHGKGDSTHVSLFGRDLLRQIVARANPTRIYADFFSQTPFIDMIARAWYLGHTSSRIPESDVEKMDWSDIIDDLIYWFEGGYNHMHKPAKTSIFNAARVSIELAYTPTLFWVPRHIPSATQGPASRWRRLFALLEITDTTIRERRKFEKKCCHLDCPQRTASKSSGKKYICLGCETVWYCDRACQKADWQKHRPACDPRHFATLATVISLYSNDSET